MSGGFRVSVSGIFLFASFPFFYPPRQQRRLVANVFALWCFSAFPEITLPDNGTFTAISVAGSTDKSETSVDTFVLYRDEKSIIQQLSRDGQSGAWSSSTPKAFTGADNDTKIACVPTLIWEEKPRWEDHWLAPPSDLTQCFFQKDGKAMETLLDGTDWEEAQEVPMS